MCVLSHSVLSDSLQPRGLKPTRLFCPWKFPGKNTGLGCHFPSPKKPLTCDNRLIQSGERKRQAYNTVMGNVILWNWSYKTVKKLTHDSFYIKYHSPYAYLRIGTVSTYMIFILPVSQIVINLHFSNIITEKHPCTSGPAQSNSTLSKCQLYVKLWGLQFLCRKELTE